ncbi:MAG TPA: serine/threonine-protein kinase [Gemmatimonadales bacterium]|jgi:serine/threonine-protein kinase
MSNADHPDDLFLALQEALAGRYSLEREIGRGGMGIVYLARDVRLDRPVALKLLPPERAARQDLRQRFLDEARMAARLAHPNIVPIHAVEEAGPFVFYAMRYVEGETLGERLRRVGNLGHPATIRILRDTAYALAYAHAQHVIHRDIKPDNILLEAGSDRAVVTDFGIARLMGQGDDLRHPVVGTPEYVAPEQAAGLEVDGRSDLYALGAVGYHCIVGRPPFEGDVQQLLAQHLSRRATPLLEAAPGTPSIFATAIDRALEKDPPLRFDTAEAFAEALGASLSTSGDLPVPVRVWVERGRELKGIYVIWSCFFYGIGTMALVGALLNSSWPWQAVVFMGLCAASSVAPWIAHGLWRLSETRKAIEAGATLDDLRHGALVALERREEELRYEASRAVHPLARLIRILTYGAFVAAIGALIGGVFISTGGRMSREFFAIFGAFTMATVGGALFGLVFPGRRVGIRDHFARLRLWFWNSPLGDLTGQLASFGLKRQVVRRWTGSRKTETALGDITATLFAALPQADRATLADLPDVVARLEDAAARARSHLAHGDDPAWAERLQRAVAAIETLRLGLLRMTTDRAAATSLSTDLDAARDLSERIGYLIEGAAEVSDWLAGSDGGDQRRTHATPRQRAASTSLG